MNVRDIVLEYLVKNGYDGLYSDFECACDLKTLVNCGDDMEDCQPGYRGVCDCEDDEGNDPEHDYHIVSEKPSCEDNPAAKKLEKKAYVDCPRCISFDYSVWGRHRCTSGKGKGTQEIFNFWKENDICSTFRAKTQE